MHACGHDAHTAMLLGTSQLVNSCDRIKNIKIMPYHPLGISKAKELDREECQIQSEIPDRQMLRSFSQRLQRKVKIPVKIRI